MQSALIVHSRHTKAYARLISKKYINVEFLEVVKPPAKNTLKIKNDKDIVIGVGGGSVIDTAKIISKDKRCIAIPTTAAGACMTPYATLWGKEKRSIPTRKPIVRMDPNAPKNLSFHVRQSTAFDALSHAVESFWSKNATSGSKGYSRKAIYLIKKFLKKNNKHINQKDINNLIIAGNLAGKAIAITKTNVVHALSYPITIACGIDHGTACGIVLPYLIEYMDFKGLPKLFDLDSTEALVLLLKKIFIPPKVKKFNANKLANKAMGYGRINDAPKKIDKKNLARILTLVQKKGLR